jgi:death-on-curing protein
MITLDKEQVKGLHKKLLEATGGSKGVRDEGLLDSALASPFQTFGGAELYPSAIEKIAQLAFSLVCNHPFFDGNKRIGVLVLLILSEINRLETNFGDDDIVRIGLGLAQGEMTKKQLQDCIPLVGQLLVMHNH